MDKRYKKRVTIEEVGEAESDRLKKLKAEKDAAAAAGGSDDTTVVPTEEEVEEFYAILRRMRVAVKYFNEKGRGGKELREVLEQSEVTVVDDEENAVDNDNHLESGCAAVNKGLDLNAVAPEAADGSDA
ncbi:PREDICTED: uncharacterized protein LOC109349769 isoform X2 [Lupinus angustifolius]|uniref:uncharacterized protein LOC109349769 isoform X2 n=1 Tax=Lupinus angustifolius TaxID=3871 RepID=UPI00092F42B1|nr:PREDICTED: uncharacterized protein LOC109349769 isoform X2 [Lupinus angustifolius]